MSGQRDVAWPEPGMTVAVETKADVSMRPYVSAHISVCRDVRPGTNIAPAYGLGAVGPAGKTGPMGIRSGVDRTDAGARTPSRPSTRPD